MHRIHARVMRASKAVEFPVTVSRGDGKLPTPEGTKMVLQVLNGNRDAWCRAKDKLGVQCVEAFVVIAPREIYMEIH